MIFWIAIAALTAASALSILVPLARAQRGSFTVLATTETAGRHGAVYGETWSGPKGSEAAPARARRAQAPAPSAAADIAALHEDAQVYRDQLQELERERGRGLVAEDAYQAARTEIARRLLAADDARAARAAAQTPASRSLSKSATVAAIVALPLLALSLYLALGSPGQPDQPLIARLDAPVEGQSVDELVARVERHLAANPQDGKGWDVLAPVYMRLGRADEAARAYANSIRLLGSTVRRQADRGEALTMANNGIVSGDAEQAFRAAQALDPQAVKPRFFLALALSQDGKREAAVAAWNALLQGADANQAWVPLARQELEKLTAQAAVPTSDTTSGPESGVAPGPDADQIDEAMAMSAADRRQMIEGMVSGLEIRLREDGGSVADWLRLMRSQMVLGRKDQAGKTVDSARTAYKEDAEALAQINAAASEFGF